jgi:pimeloyl-ACP methyl ester carboxylesterase
MRGRDCIGRANHRDMQFETGSIDAPCGGALAYLRGGAGAPRGIVVVQHGFPDHPPTFAPVIDALVARGFDVVAPWLRGYAPSTSAGPFDVERLGGDLLAIVDALAAGRPAYLVGHDWGAVATYAALVLGGQPQPRPQSQPRPLPSAHPVRAAVAISVPHPITFLRALPRDGQWRRSGYMALFQLGVADRIVRARDFAFVDRLWRTWSPGFVLDDGARRELVRCLDESWPRPLEHYRALFRPVGAFVDRVRRMSKRIATPTLYIHGADDGCIAPSAARGQERWFRGDHETAIVAGAGHFVHVERPDVVASLVADWIDRYGATR